MSVFSIIKQRRSIDPDDFNGQLVDKHIIDEMLESANWAPTHGLTEPWRFVVITQEFLSEFGLFHAELFKQKTAPEHFLEKKYNKIKNRSASCSHVIICVNKRGNKSNIPELEELAATSCAIENMLLVATAHHVGTFWSTGGMTYDPDFKKYFGFDEQDQVMGILYIGHYDIPQPTGIRLTEWQDKVRYYPFK